MQTRNSRSRSRRPVESRTCTKCPGCNIDNGRQPVSSGTNGTNGTAEKRKKRSASVDNAPRSRSRARSRGRSRSRARNVHTDSPPTTVSLGVPNLPILVNSDQAASTSTRTSRETTGTSHKTMEINTKNYCLFCFKLCNNVLSGGYGGAMNKKEVCSRFMKLLTRHLDLDIYSHVGTTSGLDAAFFAKTIKKDEGHFEIVACNACYTICESYCKQYKIYQQAQLELARDVMKLKDIMKSAEKVPSRVNDFRRNVLEGGGGMKSQEKEMMDGFRREFYRKCNRVKGYPKVVLKKLRGIQVESAIKRGTTVGLQRFHQSTRTDMVSNPTASVQVILMGDELHLTSRARAPRSKSVPPISTRTPTKPICATSVSPQVSVQRTSQQATRISTQAKINPVISKPVNVKTIPKNSIVRKETLPCPGPSKSIKKSTKVIHISKRVLAPSPQKDISLIDLCDDSDEEEDKASPPKKSKTTAAVPIVEPVIPEAPPPPPPISGDESSIMVVNIEDETDTGKDTGSTLAGNQDDNQVVMEISSQSALQPCEASTSHTPTPVTQIPETSEDHPSTSHFSNPPPEPNPSGSPGTSANETPVMIPQEMDSQPNTPTNNFPYFSPNPQFEVSQDPQYEYDYTDAPSEATGIFTQHDSPSQPMDFEFIPPAPGTGIAFPLPVTNGPCRVSYTITRTVTSTFNGIQPENFGMPYAENMYSPSTSTQEEPGQPLFCSTPRDPGYTQQQFRPSDYIPEQYSTSPENYFAPHEPVDSQPIVTFEDESNYPNNLNEAQPQDVGSISVHIAEIDEDSNDVQVIDEVSPRTRGDLTVTMNFRNESENDIRNNLETITPPVYVCT